MTAPGPEQARSASYVDMLMQNNEDGALTALETIRGAGTTEVVQNDGEQPHSPPADHINRASFSEEEVRRQGTGNREVAFRVSTPERIRSKSELLYGEIHTMLDRHDARTGREREVQRRTSRGSRVSYVERSPSTTRSAASPVHERSVVPAQTPLPDLHQMFAESRRAHLTEAQQQRTYFPSSSKPTAYSSKDPSTFSYRFQSLDPPASLQ